jgi:hypothetical protein
MVYHHNNHTNHGGGNKDFEVMPSLGSITSLLAAIFYQGNLGMAHLL